MAAEAIAPGEMNAEMLARKVQELVEGLSSYGISVASYLCDGTEVEQSIQQILTELARNVKTWMFNHPTVDHDPVVIQAPVYNGQPLIMMQDSKHLKKTLRNNIFLGA